MYNTLILNGDLEKFFSNNLLQYNILKYDTYNLSNGVTKFSILESNHVSNKYDFLILTTLRNAKDMTQLSASVSSISSLCDNPTINLIVSHLPYHSNNKLPIVDFNSKVYSQLVDSVYDWGSVRHIDTYSDILTHTYHNLPRKT